MPILDRITVFPVKSLDGVEVLESRVVASAGLEHDRRWQLTDMDGRVVNAKRTPAIQVIRACFHIAGLVGEFNDQGIAGECDTVELAVDRAAISSATVPDCERLTHVCPETFPLVPGSQGPCGWLSDVLGRKVLLVEQRHGGFPDDRDSPGPTLVSTATLAEVARWFGIDLDECRRRFRTNLEVGDCESFWEDSLASPMGHELAGSPSQSLAELPADPYAALPPPEPREVSIGRARLRATHVCRRCAVPTRDSRTGRVTEHFRDVFEAHRGRTVRHDVDAATWSHWYRLAVNTCVVTGGPLKCGDSVLG